MSSTVMVGYPDRWSVLCRVSSPVSRSRVSTWVWPEARAMTEALRGGSGSPLRQERTRDLSGSSRTAEWRA